ncbi:hypothetical protein [Rhizobium sp. ICMP 5592]|uniref:hypothetical protein n=1 Tax=Rhizobium sp. ICMP 5592 TaxID=2292445 RepID=UPI001297CC22|nr:hypothetical protein [Rhizobium sp. ICMP 5592]MQB41334.1 hypothetical protein [Rhizobium sp. ICMP 5592]
MTRDEYERDIWAGGETASFVPLKRDAGFGRWEPKIATCHGNVDYVLNPIRNSPHGDADQNTAEFNMLKIHRENRPRPLMSWTCFA